MVARPARRELGHEVHDDLLARGRRLEVATIGWNAVEVFVTVGLGLAASSLALIAFGLDSLVEIFASVVVIWYIGDHHAERRAMHSLRLVAVAFAVSGRLLAGRGHLQPRRRCRRRQFTARYRLPRFRRVRDVRAGREEAGDRPRCAQRAARRRGPYDVPRRLPRDEHPRGARHERSVGHLVGRPGRRAVRRAVLLPRGGRQLVRIRGPTPSVGSRRRSVPESCAMPRVSTADPRLDARRGRVRVGPRLRRTGPARSTCAGRTPKTDRRHVSTSMEGHGHEHLPGWLRSQLRATGSFPTECARTCGCSRGRWAATPTATTTAARVRRSTSEPELAVPSLLRDGPACAGSSTCRRSSRSVDAAAARPRSGRGGRLEA